MRKPNYHFDRAERDRVKKAPQPLAARQSSGVGMRHPRRSAFERLVLRGRFGGIVFDARRRPFLLPLKFRVVSGPKGLDGEQTTRLVFRLRHFGRAFGGATTTGISIAILR